MIYLELFLTFFKIGLFTFGGGYAMLPMIQSEVLSNGWLNSEELMNFVAVSESTPGPFAINISTYVGAQTGGILGAFCATLGVVLPSFIVILIVAKFVTAFRTSTVVNGCLYGLKAAVIGLIAAAFVSMATTVFFNSTLNAYEFTQSIIIFSIMTVLLFAKKISPILIVVFSAGLGIAFGYLLELI